MMSKYYKNINNCIFYVLEYEYDQQRDQIIVHNHTHNSEIALEIYNPMIKELLEVNGYKKNVKQYRKEM